MTALNKQTLINLLIDSPLREPIKINLIDIVNNTNEADLPKTYSTISKELEIFQKATERRMKLADETIAKLKDDGSASTTSAPSPAPTKPTEPASLPPLPTPPVPSVSTPVTQDTGLKVPPLDLPPLPTMPKQEEAPEEIPVASEPTPTPVKPADNPLPPAPSPAPTTASADEDALKEIQKELDALKSSATEEAVPPTSPTPPQA